MYIGICSVKHTENRRIV